MDLRDLWVVSEQRGSLDAAPSCFFLLQWCSPVRLLRGRSLEVTQN